MKKILLVLASLFVLTLSSNAQKIVPVGEFYIFGVAFSLTDSTVYVTELQPLSDVYINEKSKFLYSRNEYSAQLRDHLLSEGLKHMTVAVSYAKKKSKAEKKYLRLKQKYQKKNYLVKHLTNVDFSFTAVPYEESDEPSDLKDDVIKTKNKKDKKKKK